MYTLVDSSKLSAVTFISVLFGHFFKTAIISRFLMVAIATSNFMNEI